jgi:hypothetical protein
MRKAREPTYSFLILTLVLIVINVILARLAIAALPASAAGVSVLYVAVGVMILATLWFGAYGAIAAYVGTLVGAGLLAGTPSIPPAIAIFWSIAGLLQVLIPLVAFRSFEADPALENRRDWTILFVFGILLNNIVGAVWGAGTLALGGVIQSGELGGVMFTWLIGNIIVCLLIVPLGLRFLTPKVRRSKLFVKNYWD